MNTRHTIDIEAIAPSNQRRQYSPELKAQVVAQCQLSGASIAAVAKVHGISANIARRWLRQQQPQRSLSGDKHFVPLALTGDAQLPAASPPIVRLRDIRVEVRHKVGLVTVNWPLEDSQACALWLRELLR